MQTEEFGYQYTFDDGFDAVEDVYGLDTVTNPLRSELTLADTTAGDDVRSQQSQTS